MCILRGDGGCPPKLVVGIKKLCLYVNCMRKRLVFKTITVDSNSLTAFCNSFHTTQLTNGITCRSYMPNRRKMYKIRAEFHLRMCVNCAFNCAYFNSLKKWSNVLGGNLLQQILSRSANKCYKLRTGTHLCPYANYDCH